MARRAFLVLVAVALLATGCFNSTNLEFIPFPEEKLSSRVIKTIGDSRTDNRILLLDIDGPITGVGEDRLFWHQDATTTAVAMKLRKAALDKRIKGVVVRINSPGGGVTASDIVYRELQKYKRVAGVPMVTMMMDVAASGGYYIACATDEIYAHSTTITGSIGVIIFSFGADGLFEKIGLESRVIKSGELKDMGNPFDEFTDSERAVFQNVVDKMYARFVNVVSQNRRNLDRERIVELADGRIYLGDEAKELGLIDNVGYMDDAFDAAMKRAGIQDAKVLVYTHSRQDELNMYSNQLAKAPDIGMKMPDASTLMDMTRPRILYMWSGY
ncbi:MAG: signal peptide peptidase SppA [Deltaproteobacteria bacterium]|nr:signal peptide peptidase SppA [bacterium]MCB9478197.1 signal peptide peptidase SppA [Deltaproteobacteria bacterium]MCB9487250.1 signal peptide peptidase SppA [Deltaproteobacteria bacterium]